LRKDWVCISRWYRSPKENPDNRLARLGPHPDDERITELDPVQKEAFIEREIGRRVWYGVVCQEWYVYSPVEMIYQK
jgi:hypothetical protein